MEGTDVSKPLVAITGASSGIGAAAARAFSKAGHPLLLTARRVDRLEALELPNAMCRKHDVLDAEAYRSLVAEAEAAYGPVDLLVNNAGFMTLEQFAKQSPDDWRRQFDVNCVGLLNTTSAVFPSMIERETGTVINVGSTAGRNIYDNHTVYCGSKHAVHALTEGLRREGAAAGVRVVMISPGMVDTELLSSTESDAIKDGYAAYRDEIGGAISPDDIAQAMLFAYQQPQNICLWEMVVSPTRQLT
jgi:NADP-dependent 3-hydroxy acid dehydrogenase YdfG